MPSRCGLALQLTNAGVTVKSIHTTAKGPFRKRDGGWSLHRIDLDTEASISDMAAAALEEHAQNAKEELPDFSRRYPRRYSSGAKLL